MRENFRLFSNYSDWLIDLLINSAREVTASCRFFFVDNNPWTDLYTQRRLAPSLRCDVVSFSFSFCCTRGSIVLLVCAHRRPCVLRRCQRAPIGCWRHCYVLIFVSRLATVPVWCSLRRLAAASRSWVAAVRAAAATAAQASRHGCSSFQAYSSPVRRAKTSGRTFPNGTRNRL